MLIFLPIISIFFFILIFHHNSENGIRLSFIKSLLSFSVFVFIITETFGNSDLLYTNSYIFAYILLILGLFLYIKKKKVSLKFKIDKNRIAKFSSFPIIFLVIFIISPLLFLAFYIKPTNTDSFSYHLTRIMFWIQNHNIHHFKTSFLPQLYYNVFSEYLILNTIILTGTDSFANSVHFVASIGTILVATLTGRRLGLPEKGQVLIAVIVGCIPMGVLQSISTQNDYLAGFYFCCSLYFGLAAIQDNNKNYYENLLWGLIALSLGIFTKYTIFIFSIGFILFFGIYQLTINFQRAIITLAISLSVISVTFGAFFYRNYQAFNAIISPPIKTDYYTKVENSLEVFKIILSNLSKIVGNHIGLPLNSWNVGYDKLIANFHSLIGYELNNHKSTFATYYTYFSIGEDFSGNFIHLLLIFSCILVVFLTIKKKYAYKSTINTFIILLLFGLIAYSFAFKWQIFHSRTQLPFFLAFSPIIGAILYKISSKRQWLYNLTSLIILASALPFVYSNPSKPIFPTAYYLKKLLLYVPPTMGAEESLNQSQFKTLVDSGFYTEKDIHFGVKAYVITPNLSREQRKKIFDMFDSTTYYNNIKRNIFEAKEKNQKYFSFDNKSYEEFKGVFNFLRKNDNNVGIALTTEIIYPFFVFGNDKFNNQFRMSYIQFPAYLSSCYNARKPFFYSAVITNDSTMKNKFNGNLLEHKQFGPFEVILLKKPSSNNYYKDFF